MCEKIFGPYITAFGKNTEIYFVNIRIHSEYEKNAEQEKWERVEKWLNANNESLSNKLNKHKLNKMCNSQNKKKRKIEKKIQLCYQNATFKTNAKQIGLLNKPLNKPLTIE